MLLEIVSAATANTAPANDSNYSHVESHSPRTASRRPESSIRAPKDEATMRRIQSGDAEALGHLYERYSRLVLSVAMRIVHNRAEAQDLLQDVFIYIQRRSVVYDPGRGTVLSWIFQIALSRARNRRCRLSVAEQNNCARIDEVGETLAASSVPQQRLIEQLSAQKLLCGALEELPERQRETLRLVFFEGYTLREISVLHNEAPGNTRHHYYRGIKTLRRALTPPDSRNPSSPLPSPHPL
jgi:RNA polymerase sigma-70 factor (ECF subfamily)